MSLSGHKSRQQQRQSESSTSSVLLLSRDRRRRQQQQHHSRVVKDNVKQKITTKQHEHRDRKTANLLNEKSHHSAAAAAAAAPEGRGRKVQDHVAQMVINNDIEVIDLRTPVNDMSLAIITANCLAELSLTTTTSSTTKETSYISRTLRSSSASSRSISGRHSILPAFPALIDKDNDPDLLLANVPDHLLNEQERNRRYSFQFRPPFLVIGAPPTSILVNTNIPSFFWPFYQELYANVAEHFHLDMAIIDYNYTRLSKCIDIWTKERILRFKYKPHELVLDQKEYAIALEFYLQIDVDLFYMKTCSFRNVQPQEPNKYLFCSTDPVARYEMTACGNCCLCYPKYNVKRRGQPSIDFGSATQRHQFVNKYETILNCPCSCTTRNIIYVLTCPCGKFDYIGETSATLADRIQAHRFHGNRIMHEAFLGQKNIQLAHPNHVKSAETLSKDDMHLYRHSIECRSAIQMFLDENPQYWPFVPMLNEEADRMEENILTSTMDFKSTDLKDEDRIKLFIKNLPPPPSSNYRFSTRQYHFQFAYFKSRPDSLGMPNEHLDLYNAKIIAVLPETGSTVLRQIVESLFITHTEAKLNSSGYLVSSNHNQADAATAAADIDASSRHQNVLWCEGLVRRPQSSFVTAQAPTISTSNIGMERVSSE